MNTSRCACSEFPNENPVLDAGVIRVKGLPCRCAAPRRSADLVARYGTLPGLLPQLFWDSRDEPSPPPELAETEFDAALPPPEETLEVDVDTSDADGGFSALVRAMQAVLLREGATRAAALLGPLMSGGAVELSALDERASFDSGPLLVQGGRLGLRLSDEETRAGWRRVLSGQEADLSVCGPGTLDRWAAELVAALLGAPARTDELRRELRRRGVAAFGMLEAA